MKDKKHTLKDIGTLSDNIYKPLLNAKLVIPNMQIIDLETNHEGKIYNELLKVSENDHRMIYFSGDINGEEYRINSGGPGRSGPSAFASFANYISNKDLAVMLDYQGTSAGTDSFGKAEFGKDGGIETGNKALNKHIGRKGFVLTSRCGGTPGFIRLLNESYEFIENTKAFVAIGINSYLDNDKTSDIEEVFYKNRVLNKEGKFKSEKAEKIWKDVWDTIPEKIKNKPHRSKAHCCIEFYNEVLNVDKNIDTDTFFDALSKWYNLYQIDLIKEEDALTPEKLKNKLKEGLTNKENEEIFLKTIAQGGNVEKFMYNLKNISHDKKSKELRKKVIDSYGLLVDIAELRTTLMSFNVNGNFDREAGILPNLEKLSKQGIPTIILATDNNPYRAKGGAIEMKKAFNNGIFIMNNGENTLAGNGIRILYSFSLELVRLLNAGISIQDVPYFIPLNVRKTLKKYNVEDMAKDILNNMEIQINKESHQKRHFHYSNETMLSNNGNETIINTWNYTDKLLEKDKNSSQIAKSKNIIIENIYVNNKKESKKIHKDNKSVLSIYKHVSQQRNIEKDDDLTSITAFILLQSKAKNTEFTDIMVDCLKALSHIESNKHIDEHIKNNLIDEFILMFSNKEIIEEINLKKGIYNKKLHEYKVKQKQIENKQQETKIIINKIFDTINKTSFDNNNHNKEILIKFISVVSKLINTDNRKIFTNFEDKLKYYLENIPIFLDTNIGEAAKVLNECDDNDLEEKYHKDGFFKKNIQKFVTSNKKPDIYIIQEIENRLKKEEITI